MLSLPLGWPHGEQLCAKRRGLRPAESLCRRTCARPLAAEAVRRNPDSFPSENFMRGVGRFLQLVGLVLLPLASILQLSGTISVGRMLQFLVVGICAFGIGWILTTYRIS